MQDIYFHELFKFSHARPTREPRQVIFFFLVITKVQEQITWIRPTWDQTAQAREKCLYTEERKPLTYTMEVLAKGNLGRWVGTECLTTGLFLCSHQVIN